MIGSVSQAATRPTQRLNVSMTTMVRAIQRGISSGRRVVSRLPAIISSCKLFLLALLQLLGVSRAQVRVGLLRVGPERYRRLGERLLAFPHLLEERVLGGVLLEVL